MIVSSSDRDGTNIPVSFLRRTLRPCIRWASPQPDAPIAHGALCHARWHCEGKSLGLKGNQIRRARLWAPWMSELSFFMIPALGRIARSEKEKSRIGQAQHTNDKSHACGHSSWPIVGRHKNRGTRPPGGGPGLRVRSAHSLIRVLKTALAWRPERFRSLLDHPAHRHR